MYCYKLHFKIKVLLGYIDFAEGIVFSYTIKKCNVIWRKISVKVTFLYDLTYCGLVRPYANKDFGQHWLR